MHSTPTSQVRWGEVRLPNVATENTTWPPALQFHCSTGEKWKISNEVIFSQNVELVLAGFGVLFLSRAEPGIWCPLFGGDPPQRVRSHYWLASSGWLFNSSLLMISFFWRSGEFSKYFLCYSQSGPGPVLRLVLAVAIQFAVYCPTYLAHKPNVRYSKVKC